VTDEQIQALRTPGGDQGSLFTEEERAAIRYARQLTAFPSGVTQADLGDLARYFSAEQIVELTMTIGTANLTNRFNDGLLVPVDV
jgi:alkylhydroperoxidase family enzyme